MRLVLQRANGDCGIAALASVLEQSYEDVYIAAASVDKKTRGRSGICFPALIAIGKKLGASFLLKRHHQDEDEGLLTVLWAKPHKHPFDAHLVVLAYGVIADPADGIVLPTDEYLTRYRATAGSFLELQ
jgi:ABC-type bacteriocin/lantibiotic exporter with double-glycine peptidase domain